MRAHTHTVALTHNHPHSITRTLMHHARLAALILNARPHARVFPPLRNALKQACARTQRGALTNARSTSVPRRAAGAIGSQRAATNQASMCYDCTDVYVDPPGEKATGHRAHTYDAWDASTPHVTLK
jgi:hypothetical protein